MWIKICGITSVDDAQDVVAAGANAIGLNFYPQSRRFVTREAATTIARSVPASLDIVGVFVNAAPEQIAATIDRVGLTAVQFHGDESIDDIVRVQSLCPNAGIIRAVRLGKNRDDLASQLQPLARLELPLDAVLVDAFVDGEYGGTGNTVPPEQFGNHDAAIRLILAGGLTPENVAERAGLVRPWGVDTASGVEQGPGRKSAELIEQFVEACRSIGFDHTASRLRD